MLKTAILGILTASLLLIGNLNAQDAPPLVRLITLDGYASEEGPDLAHLLVLRLGGTNVNLEVSYTVSGTAENEVDYQSLPGVVTLPEGQWAALISITPIDDAEVEGRESIIVELDSPAGAAPPSFVGFPRRAVVSLDDNDTENQLPHISLVTPPDGAAFFNGETIHLTASTQDPDGFVEMVEFFANDVSLGVVTNRPSLPPDVVANAAFLLQLRTEPGASANFQAEANAEVDVNLARPTLVHFAPFTLAWTGAAPGDYELTAVATDNRGGVTVAASIKVTVSEELPPTVVNIFARDPIAGEGPAPTAADATDAPVNSATFVVHRRGDLSHEIEVAFRFDGEATPGEDFGELPTQVILPAGEESVSFTLVPIDDDLVEGREKVIVHLVEPACAAVVPEPEGCYQLGQNRRAEAVILDNDRPDENLVPRVKLLQPRNGDTFLAPTNITLVAGASDPDGEVKHVEFFAGNRSLGIVEAPEPPMNSDTSTTNIAERFSLVWEDVPIGFHLLRARATDNEDATAWSEPVHIRVTSRTHPAIVGIVANDPVAHEAPMSSGGGEGSLEPSGTDAPAMLDTAQFRVRRDSPANTDLTVYYAIAGTAENGADYQTLNGAVTIPAGHEAAPIDILPINDNLAEGRESIVISLVHPAAVIDVFPPPPLEYLVGPNSRAQAVIIDDEPAPPAAPRVELVSPHADAVFRFGASIHLAARAQDPDGAIVSVEFFADGNSLGLGRPPLSDTPIMVPHTTQMISLAGVYQLTWTNASLGAHVLTALATDDDGLTTMSAEVHIKVTSEMERTIVHIEETDPKAAEGFQEDSPTNSGIDPAIFTVVRHGMTNFPLTVYYRIGGTAENGVDYDMLTGEVIIPEGERRAEIVIFPIDDNLAERDESVIIELVAPHCIAVAPPPPDCYMTGERDRAIAVIEDNDESMNERPKIAIIQPATGDQFQVGNDIKIIAEAVDPDGWLSQVEFFANNHKIGESTINYIVPPPPGQRQQFELAWTEAPAGIFALRARTVDQLGVVAFSEPVHIVVRDANANPVVNIFARDPQAVESADEVDTGTFVVTRSGRTNETLTVQLIIGGSATPNMDYAALPFAVTFAEGETSTTVTVTPINDNLAEHAETVNAGIGGDSTTQPYDAGPHHRATVVILDDDRVNPNPVDPNRPHAELLVDGTAYFTVPGPNGAEVSIEVSEDLKTWHILRVAIMAEGRITIADSDPAGRRFNFYRVRRVSDLPPSTLLRQVGGE